MLKSKGSANLKNNNNFKERAALLKRDIPAVYLAMKKKETPALAKCLAGIAVVYALSPIDLIPDFIPVLGYLDDLILVPLLVGIAVKRIPPAVLEECRRESEELWINGKPKKWVYALPVILIWTILLYLVIKIFL